MGADIHLFVEYDNSKYGDPFLHDKNIHAFADGDFLIYRDYRLFAALAGVRAHADEKCKILPKGIPKKLSCTAFSQYYQYVLDVGEQDFSDNCVTREEADCFVQQGKSIYIDSRLKERKHITNPDYHTPSFLNYGEVDYVINNHPLVFEDLDRNFRAVVVLLRELEQSYGKDRSRIVFWFDN